MGKCFRIPAGTGEGTGGNLLSVGRGIGAGEVERVDIFEPGSLQFFESAEKVGGALDTAISLQELKVGVIAV